MNRLQLLSKCEGHFRAIKYTYVFKGAQAGGTMVRFLRKHEKKPQFELQKFQIPIFYNQSSFYYK